MIQNEQIAPLISKLYVVLPTFSFKIHYAKKRTKGGVLLTNVVKSAVPVVLEGFFEIYSNP